MSFPPVAELVPHAPPMVLLDEVVRWEDDEAACTVRIGVDSPFVQDGRVRAAVALEYMAQCVAVYTSLRSRKRGETMRKGYLVGARTMQLEVDFFHVDDELLVEVREDFDGDELGSFTCSIRRGESTVATATLSVYRGPRAGGCL